MPPRHFAAAEIAAYILQTYGVVRRTDAIYNHIARGTLVPDFLDLTGHNRFYERTIRRWHEGARTAGRPRKVKGAHRKQKP